MHISICGAYQRRMCKLTMALISEPHHWRSAAPLEFKPSPLLDSLPSLTISSNHLQCMSSFHYLGFTRSLSWSPTFQMSIPNLVKFLASFLDISIISPLLINTILHLYSSLVHPILKYCSPVWFPNSVSTSNSLESIQPFVLKIASKFHSPASSPLTLPSLSSRRLQARIKLLFAITRNLYFLPSPVVFLQTCPPYPIRSYHPSNPLIFCQTSFFSRSFFPSTIKIWNSLLPLLQNDSVLLFFPLSLSILLL